MEETLNKLNVIYIGNIGDKAYFNVEYTEGFKETTQIKIIDVDSSDFKLINNSTKNSDSTIKTLIVTNSNPNLIKDYTIQLFEDAVLTEEVTVKNDATNVPALIKENVHVRAVSDRILEIAFDEPVQNLESNFDFNIDSMNKKPLKALTAEGSEIYEGIQDSNQIVFIKKGAEYYPVNTDGTEGTVAIDTLVNGITAEKPILIDTTNLNLSANKYDELLEVQDVLTIGGTGYTCYVMFDNPYSQNTKNDHAVLTNYYFRYFGDDDEGTLYEPTDKPLDWLGYFATKDITTRVSPDNRKLEIQFNNYSLPTGDTHQLIINYSKTFPNFPTNLRIIDTNNNTFPIVSELVPINKLANKAVVTKVVALSQDEILVTYDKPVLCQNDESPYIITINTQTPELVSRYGNTYNTLLCKLPTPLTIGEKIPIEVGSIIDGCGYKTNVYQTTIEILAIPPEVLSLKQNKGGIEGEETRLEIKFSDNMSPVDTDVTPYFEIYKITDASKELITPISLEKASQKDDELIVSIKPSLETGELYEINILGLTDLAGIAIVPYKGVIEIKDISEPHISAIYLTDNTAYTEENEQYKIAILFNEVMNDTGFNGLENYENYLLITPKDVSALPISQCEKDTITKTVLSSENCLDITSIKNNRAVRITLNKEEIPTVDDNSATLNFIPDHIMIKAGYCGLNDIKYLVNNSGNILDFVCPKDEVISKPISLDSLTTADFEVIDSQTIIMTYKAQNNEILEANHLAFKLVDNSPNEITALTTVINPVTSIQGAPDTDINKTGTITIKFPKGSLDNLGQKIIIDNTCKDIFGNTVKEMTDSVALTYTPIPRLMNAYLAALHNDAALFALEFNEKVQILGTSKLAGRDYSVSVNGQNPRSVTAIGSLVGDSDFDGVYVEAPKGDRKILFLQYDNENGKTFMKDDKFSIKVTAYPEQFRTVEPLTNKPVEIFGEREITSYLPIPDEVLEVSKFELSALNKILSFTVSTASGNPIDSLDKNIDNLAFTYVTNTANLISLSENSFFKYVNLKPNTTFTPDTNIPVLTYENTPDGKLKFNLDFTAITDFDATAIDSIDFEFRDALITVDGLPVKNDLLTALK